MKKLLSAPVLAAFVLMAFSTSCKKSSTDAPAAAGSGGLTAGKSSMAFNNTGSFAGGTTFSVSNTPLTSAQTLTNALLRNVTLSASEVTGVNSRITSLLLVLPASASTTNGNLVADFSLPNNATILPTLTLTSSSGATSGITYGSQSGTCTITKLTTAEIEGTFTCVVKDVNGNTTLSVTGGTFAGKF